MPTLRVKRYAVRDANTLVRLGSHRNWMSESLAQGEADKLVKKGYAAIVVPVEE
jgi:hypothetical protein